MSKVKVTLVMVQTLDGVIARDSEELVDWSSKEDKKHFREVTQRIGCLISGSSSFDTFPKPWRDRETIVLTSRPEEYKEKYSDYPNLHFMSAESPEEVIRKVEELGFSEVALIGGSKINTFFAKEHFLDEIYLTIEPVLFGKGLNLFTEELELDLKLLSVENLNEDTLLLKYRVDWDR